MQKKEIEKYGLKNDFEIFVQIINASPCATLMSMGHV
jgi:hypothetical protein